MPRTVAREVPRWKQRGSKNNLPGFTPADRKFTAAVAREVAKAQVAAAREPGEGRAGSRGTAARNDVLARTGAWRFRRHLRPFLTLAALLVLGAVLHGVPMRWLWAGLASLAVPAVMAGAARLKERGGKPLVSAWVRRYTDLEGLWAGCWLPFLAISGVRPHVAWLLVTWLPFAGLWVRRFRWQPAPPGQAAAGPTGDLATWEKLAAKRKWTGHLGAPEPLPGGGRKYEIFLDGVETHIGQVMAEPRAVAAAYHRPRTEVYVETHPSAVESKGILTILSAGTFERTEQWDGRGFGADGSARVGRFGDGLPTRIRSWVPRNGTVHSLIAGTTGSGKTATLDLILWLALTSEVPVVPIILDPQNGQSLPQWKDKVLYVAGLEECVRMVRALDVASEERSRQLASMTWDDDGHRAKGMDFFDARLSGLPVIMPFFEEAPEILKGGGNSKLAAEMVRLIAKKAKLGRKAGESVQLVTQVPSLAELGGDQALRAMLAGGNVICMRTAEKVSAGMIGLDADPSSLPKYFPSGEPTAGLGFAVSVDNRQAPMRADLIPGALRHKAVDMPVPDDNYLEAMHRVLDKISPTSAVAPVGPPKPPAAVAPLPDPEPADDAPEGRRCIDAVWLVLSSRAQDMTRGEVIKWTGDLAKTWDRKKWTVKAIQTALGALTDGTDPKHRADGHQVTREAAGVYRAAVAESPAEDLK